MISNLGNNSTAIKRSRQHSLVAAMSRAFANPSPSSVSWKRPHFRLCHLQKDAHDNYGFTICPSEANTTGCHIISKVKENSAATKSGLCLHDRLIEVNGCNVESENANQIETRIRNGLRIGCVSALPSSPIGESRSSSGRHSRTATLSETKPILESLSSNDSGLIADARPIYGNNVDSHNVNECLLLVLDPKSYTLYNCNRSIFLSTAPVVFMKPTAQVLPDQMTNCVGADTSEDGESQMLEEMAGEDSEVNGIKSESLLLSSSNDSFEILESKIEATNRKGGFSENDEQDSETELCELDASTDAIQSPTNTKLMQLPYEDHLTPRLCYLKKRSKSSGFGFHLISPRNSRIQIISSVDEDSPASSAGLRDNDVVIEVNGVNVLNENHREVVTRITEGVIRQGQRHRDEVVLLVVSAEAKEWYDKNGILINYRLPNILIIGNNTCQSPHMSTSKFDETAYISYKPPPRELLSTSEDLKSLHLDEQPQICKTSIEVKLENNKKESIEELRGDEQNKVISPKLSQQYKSQTLNPVTETANGTLNSSGFAFANMNVAQMRELLRQRGGKQSIIDQCNKLTLHEKYQIIQNM